MEDAIKKVFRKAIVGEIVPRSATSALIQIKGGAFDILREARRRRDAVAVSKANECIRLANEALLILDGMHAKPHPSTDGQSPLCGGIARTADGKAVPPPKEPSYHRRGETPLEAFYRLAYSTARP